MPKDPFPQPEPDAEEPGGSPLPPGGPGKNGPGGLGRDPAHLIRAAGRYRLA